MVMMMVTVINYLNCYADSLLMELLLELTSPRDKLEDSDMTLNLYEIFRLYGSWHFIIGAATKRVTAYLPPTHKHDDAQTHSGRFSKAKQLNDH